MKKSLILVSITLMFVVLGCSLDRFTDNKDEVPTPVPSTDSSPISSDQSPASDELLDTMSDSSKADLSMDKFEKIELDMSYDQVKDIIGSEGNETSSTKSANYESSSYQWKGEKTASIRTRFRNSKLVSKSQSGMTSNDGTADLTQAKFNEVKNGMSYAEVKTVLGSDGEMTRMSKIGDNTTASYTWKGKKFSRIIMTFKNDSLENKTQVGLK